MNAHRRVALGMLVLAACNAKASPERTASAEPTSSASAAPANVASAVVPSASVAPPALTTAPAASPSPSVSFAAPVMLHVSDAGPSDHPLARYKQVIHVGDSMVGYAMGIQLELGKMFKGIGVRYESLTVTAAGLHSFAGDKHVAKMVKAKDPDLVIVQVGVNNLTVPHPEAYLPDVKSIVAQVGDHPCVWIGPIPLEQPEHGMRAMIRDNVAPCVFFDSWDLELKRQEDKIHPTQPAAKKWANAFWEFAKTSAPGPKKLLDAGAP